MTQENPYPAATLARAPAVRTYADSGVNIDEGNRLVTLIKPIMLGTMREWAIPSTGRGLNTIIDLSKCGVEGASGHLVAGADGVGTKPKMIDFLKDILTEEEMRAVRRCLGIDAVGMSKNDLLRQRAKPLFLLDYYGTGKLIPEIGAELIGGVGFACTEVESVLLGGETAEMPDVYPGDNFDLVTFAAGIIDPALKAPLEPVQAGDYVIGVPSDGVHSNGWSKVRQAIREQNLDLGRVYPAVTPTEDRKLWQELMRPTRLYNAVISRALRTGKVKDLAHITGGGLIEKPVNMLPDGLAIHFRTKWLGLPPLFRFLQAVTGLSDFELRRTFNCGWGMLLVVSQKHTNEVLRALGEGATVVGKVVRQETDDRVVFH